MAVSPRPVPQSALALNNVEYLCLKMLLNPGQSQRFYRRALAVYRGWETGHQELGFAGYFSRLNGSRYRGGLWRDSASASIPIQSFRVRGCRTKRPVVSKMYLTNAGIRRALKAAEKVKLDLPDLGSTWGMGVLEPRLWTRAAVANEVSGMQT
jgi:hypothetical protein